MTTLIDAPDDAPQIHALIVGVDHYPHCGPSNQRRIADEWRIASDVVDVTCATPSAVALVDWLSSPIGRTAVPAPVGSIELLISATETMTYDAGGGAIEIEKATFARTEAAYRRWRERCDRRPDNIGLMYFCGHGLSIGGRDVLLLSDFADPSASLFRNALDFSGTHLAMQHCRADIQCYFIDACRTIPESILGTVDYAGQRFDDPIPPLPTRDNPIVYSAAPRETAPAPEGVSTPFARAVVQALDGLAAEHQIGWEIRTNRLLLAIKMIMDWNERGRRSAQVLAPGGVCRNGLIRSLPNPPAVPFELGLDPDTALGEASLRLASRRQQLSRQPMIGPWSGTATGGAYEFSAEFDPRGPYRSDADYVAIEAPYRQFKLAVDKR